MGYSPSIALQEDDALDGGEVLEELVLESSISVLRWGTLKLSGVMRCGKLQFRILYNVCKTKSYVTTYRYVVSKIVDICL